MCHDIYSLKIVPYFSDTNRLGVALNSNIVATSLLQTSTRVIHSHTEQENQLRGPALICMRNDIELPRTFFRILLIDSREHVGASPDCDVYIENSYISNLYSCRVYDFGPRNLKLVGCGLSSKNLRHLSTFELPSLPAAEPHCIVTGRLSCSMLLHHYKNKPAARLQLAWRECSR